MKKILLLLIIHSTLYIVNCFSQQYGWVDISSNLPPSNGTASLSDLHFIRDDEGWICSGALGEIYHTTDGGQTFTTQTTQYSTNAIYMLNSLLGYAGGQQGRIYKTTDGGTNWVVHGSIGSALLDIDFPPNSDSGYCCGYNGKIYKITSSGINAMGSGVTENLSSISFPSSGLGWTCGGSLIINYNGSWSQQDPPVESYNGIFMINENTGWVVGALGVIVNTSDGGTNWHNYQINPDSSNRSLNNVFFLVVNEGWAVGNSGVVLHTTNGGITWSAQTSGTTAMLRDVFFTSTTNGYAVGNNGTILHYTQLTDVEEQPTQPTEFKLEQNYPNPFNPSTSIQYSIGNRQFVQLKVYDILGNEIATLVDEEKPAGSYEVEFKSTAGSHQLASGIYYYQLRAGEYIQTKKMILMK